MNRALETNRARAHASLLVAALALGCERPQRVPGRLSAISASCYAPGPGGPALWTHRGQFAGYSAVQACVVPRVNLQSPVVVVRGTGSRRIEPEDFDSPRERVLVVVTGSSDDEEGAGTRPPPTREERRRLAQQAFAMRVYSRLGAATGYSTEWQAALTNCDDAAPLPLVTIRRWADMDRAVRTAGDALREGGYGERIGVAVVAGYCN